MLELGEHAYVMLHLWMLPAFSDAISLTVYYKHGIHMVKRTNPESIPFVKEVRWVKSSKDIGKHHTTREAALSQVIFLGLLQQGSQIQIPIINTPFSLGLDGTSFGLEMPGHGFGSYRLTWWSNGPEVWKPLTTWFHEMVEFLTQALDHPEV